MSTPAVYTESPGQRWPATALACLLGLSALVLVPVGVENLRRDSDWAIADWLINYSGGFVRRGLTGSLALLFRPLHLAPGAPVLVLQLALYTGILFAVWSLLRQVRWTPILVALVFSPATLQFPLMDPNFAFRKEILFFALLGGLLVLLRQGTSAAVIVPLLTAGGAVCILSHEALLVFFPYLFAAPLLGLSSTKQAFTWAILPTITAALLFLLVSHHPGNAAISHAVCSSVGGTLTDPPSGLCGGAIAYLSRPSSYARGEVRRVAAAEHYSRIIPVLLALTLLPIALQLRALWHGGRRRAVRILLCSSLVSVLASVTLFLYGTDWTRWIYIHAFSLMLLLAFSAPQRQPGQLPSPATGPTQSRFRIALTAVGLLLYVFAWNLSLYQPKLPLGGLVHYLVKAHRG